MLSVVHSSGVIDLCNDFGIGLDLLQTEKKRANDFVFLTIYYLFCPKEKLYIVVETLTWQ